MPEAIPAQPNIFLGGSDIDSLEVPEYNTEWSDYGNALQVGAAGLASGINRLAETVTRGNPVSEAFADNARFWENVQERQAQQYSPGAKQALAKKFATTDVENAAWADLSSVLLHATQSLPATAITLTPIGAAVRLGITSKAALAGIGAVTEGLVGAGYVAGDIAQEIESLSTEQLDQIPGVSDLRLVGWSDNQIKTALKEQQQSTAVPVAGAITAATGAIAGPLEAKIFAGSSRLARRTARGVAIEAPQEAVQEASENAAVNVALGRDATENLAEAALGGAFAGGPTGGAFAAVAGGKTRKQKVIEQGYKEVFKEGDSEKIDFYRRAIQTSMGEEADVFIREAEEDAAKELERAKRKVVTPEQEEALKVHEDKQAATEPEKPTAPTELPPEEVEASLREQALQEEAEEEAALAERERETLAEAEQAEETSSKEAAFVGTGVEHFDQAVSTSIDDVSKDPNVGKPVTTKSGKPSKAKVRPLLQRAEALAGLVDDVVESLSTLRKDGYDVTPIQKVLDSFAKARKGRTVGETILRRFRGRSEGANHGAIDNFLNDLQKARDQVVEAGTQEVFPTESTPAPEPRKTIRAQIKAVQEGVKTAVLVTPGTRVKTSDIPKGFVRSAPLPNKKGTLIYKKGDTATIKAARAWAKDEGANPDFVANILNFGVGTKPATETVTTVRDKKGTVVQDVVGEGGAIQEAAEEVASGVEGIVETRTAEEALTERAKEVEAEKPISKKVSKKKVSKATIKKAAKEPAKTTKPKKSTPTLGLLVNKSAPDNLWQIAQGTSAIDIANARKVTGVTDKNISPERIRTLLDMAVKELTTKKTLSDNLPDNEKAAIKQLKVFAKATAAKGSLVKQVKELPRPVELISEKTGKGLTGEASTEAKIKLTGKNAEEVTKQILDEIEPIANMEELEDLVLEAIRDPDGETALTEFLEDINTDPATQAALIETIQAGRMLLSDGVDTAYDKNEVIANVVKESDDRLSTEEVNNLITALNAVSVDKRGDVLSSLSKTLVSTYGISKETANNLTIVINETIGTEGVERGTTLFEQQEEHRNVAGDAEVLEVAIREAMEAKGLIPEGAITGRQSIEVLNQRVEAGKFLANMVLELNQNNAYLPMPILLDIMRRQLHKNDSFKKVLDKISTLNFTKGVFRPWAFTGHTQGNFETFVNLNGEITRIIRLNTGTSARALSGIKRSDISSLTLTHALVHEAVHMATAARIKADSKLRNKINDLMFDTQKHLDSINSPDTPYGLINELEFIAEAFSSVNFAALLNRAPSGNTTVWAKLLDFIKDILGLKRNTVLDEVIALTDTLFMTEAQANRLDRYLRDDSRDVTDINTLLEQKDSVYDNPIPTDDKYKDILSIHADEFSASAAGILVDGFHNDGKKAFDAIITTLKAAGSKFHGFMMGNMMLDQIQTTYKNLFSGLMPSGIKLIMQEEYKDINNPLDVLITALQRRQAAAKKFEADHNALLVKIKQLERAKPEEVKRMYQVAHDATMAQVHPDLPWNNPNNQGFHKGKRDVKTAEQVHARIRNEFNALPKDVRDAYLDMSAFYLDVHAVGRGKIISNIIRKHGLDELKHTAFAARLTDTLTNKQINELEFPSDIDDVSAAEIRSALKSLNQRSLQNGPYFPLMRHGDYIVEANMETQHTFKLADYKNKTKMANAMRGFKARLKAESQGSRFKDVTVDAQGNVTFTHVEYVFTQAESKIEAERLRDELQAKGMKVGNIRIKGHADFSNLEGASKILAIAERKLRGSEDSKEAARIALREAIITFMPDTAAQKRLLKRTNQAGASTDMGRALAGYMKSAAWSLANLDFASDIAEAGHALDNADKVAGRADNNYSDEDVITMKRVASELRRRITHSNEPGVITEYASKIGFFNYLFSISYSVVNSTQPALIALPYLSGKFGTGKAAAALVDAYKRVGGKIAKEAWNTRFGFNAFTTEGVDANQIVSDLRRLVAEQEGGQELADMIKTLQDQDIIGATLTLEIAEAARGRGRKGPVSKTFQKVLEMGRTMPHIVEIMNRTTTAIAAYNLFMQGKSKTQANREAATRVAELAIRKTQFDYSELNRPFNFVRNDLLRAMTMFKIHPLGVYGLFIGNIKTLLDNKSTRQQGREAGKTLAMLLATHASVAGLAGSLLMEPIKIAMGMLGLLFEDDDEMKKWLSEPEIAMRQMLYEVTGSREASEALVFGAPRAIGMDMHTRIGLQSLMFMFSNQGDTAFERSMNTVTDSLLGPIFGMERGFATMAAALANGQGWAKATEYAMPKGIRDIQRTIRYNQIGMTDFNGNLIQDSNKFSAKDLAIRAIGFSPSLEAETNLGRGYKQRRIGRLRRKVKGLVNRWKNADPAGRRELWQGEIREFNQGLSPEERRAFRVTMGTLQRSLTARRRRERETKKGIHFNRKERALAKELDFINL